jgi:hypothetical protein
MESLRWDCPGQVGCHFSGNGGAEKALVPAAVMSLTLAGVVAG